MTGSLDDHPSLADLFGLDDEELSWQERALCAQVDPEAFFPEKGGSTREAKKICTGCEVRTECLEYALTNQERFGIWGGLSERERRRLIGPRVDGRRGRANTDDPRPFFCTVDDCRYRATTADALGQHQRRFHPSHTRAAS